MMETDKEFKRLLTRLPKKIQNADLFGFYLLAKEAGRQQGQDALEQALMSDATIEAAFDTFGWGRRKKVFTITQRNLIREILRIAKERMAKKREASDESEQR